ncbi:MAG: glycosyltransferase family 4 protein [Trichodesmium sp. St18_bin1]|nr:glycosyltransferase family 4 protein [Trichodesmium sp. St18_bin1]MDE5118759.1 glycosyltransferase family 4 protein [Trichodesmium sp. St19_bin1]
MNIPSLRTLFITTAGDPYPPTGGVHLRYLQQFDIMSQFGSVAVFSMGDKESKEQAIPGVDLRYHYNTTERKNSLRQKLELRFPWLYPGKYPYRSKVGKYTKDGAKKFQKLLTEFKPDLVIAEMWTYRYFPLVKSYGCHFILDQHNVHGVWLEEIYRAYSEIEQRKLTIRQKIELVRTKPLERRLVRQADQVWICSDADQKQLQSLYGPLSHSQVIPNGIKIANYDCIHLGKYDFPEGLDKGGKNILYLGRFSYSVNAEAVELLINEIYPRLRQVYPDCQLLLVGRNPNQRMVEAAQRDSGIIVTGAVSDIRPYLAVATVMAVPLRHGGGTRLKILEAFAAKCPVVSTAKGAEGLQANDGEHLLIRDEAEGMVEGVCQLLSDPSLGARLANSAYELVKTEYSWQAVGKKIESAIRELF